MIAKAETLAIRPYQPATDREALEALYRAQPDTVYSANRPKLIPDDPVYASILVAEKDGVPVAFLSMRKVLELELVMSRSLSTEEALELGQRFIVRAAILGRLRGGVRELFCRIPPTLRRYRNGLCKRLGFVHDTYDHVYFRTVDRFPNIDKDGKVE